MIVADSSYITEGVLEDRALLQRDTIVTPDLGIYETVGAIWKHQVALGKVSDGAGYVSVLADLIRTNRLLAVDPGPALISSAYDIAVRHRSHPHDAVFVAMAIGDGLELYTLDAGQKRMYEQERSSTKTGGGHGRTDRRGGAKRDD